MRSEPKSMNRRLFAALICAIALPSHAAPARGGYHVVDVFPVPGEGGFDYLTTDEVGRRLYLSHGDRVEVLDLDSGKVVGRVADTRGVHGIAVAPDLGRGFTSNGETSNVTIFDLKTLKPLGAVATGKGPDAIIYEPATRRVFTFNGGDHSATAIDAASGRVLATIDLKGAPEFAAADGKGDLFVNLGPRSVGRLDAKALRLEETRTLGPACLGPTSMAMDQAHRRIFIACATNVMEIVNADTLQTISEERILPNTDGTVFDPASGDVFNASIFGRLVIHHQDDPDKYSRIGIIQTMFRAKTLAFDSKTGRIFTMSQGYIHPAPTAQDPSPGEKPIPGSFVVQVIGKAGPR